EILCRELGTCKDTSFIGTVNNTTEILSIADLFLLPSETESFGLSALEAMAVGVPVVSTNTGGIPEVNEHNFSGMTSNVGDVDDMAKNAIYILEDKERHETFSKNALKKAAEFDLNEVVEQYVTLYKKVINQ
ncbi:MAG: glycosyltransferase, partial [Flavobacteriales bacterium]